MTCLSRQRSAPVVTQLISITARCLNGRKHSAACVVAGMDEWMNGRWRGSSAAESLGNWKFYHYHVRETFLFLILRTVLPLGLPSDGWLAPSMKRAVCLSIRNVKPIKRPTVVG